ncbi:MAG: hypothetical protein E7663_02845 [Ruminococcaceae bacterium]|nr:hypothetical protein [Oscillospiraceae bacterium]
MIYTCQHCGAWFSAKDIRAALEKNETVIVCKSCGMVNEFREMKSSHAARGYDYLCIGDFYRASYSFSTAIDDAKRHAHHPSPDTYLGYALAQFRVQTVFSDDDSARLELPELICHRCNEMYFSDSEAYMNAKNSIKTEMEVAMQAEQLQKLDNYAKYIDGIKDYYDGIKRTKGSSFKYNTFIAYEDRSAEIGNRGYEYANKVRNSLPDRIKDVFLPDIEEYSSDEEYEAAILYALENSSCMLVITDNDIDSRLTNLYSRFYYISREQKKGGNNLGFVRYCGHITIALPDRTIAEKNVFDIENKADYCNFVLSKNGIVHDVSVQTVIDTDVRNLIDANPDDEVIAADDFGSDKPYHSLPGKFISFGSYPQKHVANKELEEHFLGYGRPSPSDDKGWCTLSYTKKGNPHMWYRDEVVGEKKYRAVYFSKARELYSVQSSDILNASQKKNGYLPMRVYCFEFEPIIWQMRNITGDTAILIANHGIDSREYNNTELSGDWSRSTIHRWLNEEFVKTAFTEEEQEYLGMLDSVDENDRIYLVDRSFDRDFYSDSQRSIRGSDYYKCIGGLGEFSINNYWITAGIGTNDREANVVFPSSKAGLGTQYVDCTGVAVLPKIVIKLS